MIPLFLIVCSVGRMLVECLVSGGESSIPPSLLSTFHWVDFTRSERERKPLGPFYPFQYRTPPIISTSMLDLFWIRFRRSSWFGSYSRYGSGYRCLGKNSDTDPYSDLGWILMPIKRIGKVDPSYDNDLSEQAQRVDCGGCHFRHFTGPVASFRSGRISADK